MGWQFGDTVYVVLDEDAERWEQDIIELFSNSGIVFAMSDTIPAGAKVLSVGDVGAGASETAHTVLSRSYDELDGTASYILYVKDGCLALAYDSMLGRYAALEYFFEQYENLDLSKSGTVVKEQFDSLAYATEKREEMREEGFAALGGKISDGAVEALRNLYGMYDERIYMWLANLWDPDTGGFYYSESARNTNGFLPDIESTVQALSFLESSGILADYGNNYAKALSEEEKASLLSFAKNMQDPEDGYFYHTQWGKNVGVSRRGRDLGWAVKLIAKLGSKPYYDTPNGYKGELGAPGGSEVSLTFPLGVSSVTAVSKVMPASTHPEYLQSTAAFKEYLESLDFETNSYGAGNTLDAQMGQIGAAGKEYKELLIEFLNEHQYAHNGLWEEQTDYDSVNGLMKISGLYGSCKATIPNAEAAMRSAMSIAATPDGAAHVCSVYNPWVAMNNTLESVAKVDGKERAEELRALLRADAENLITITLNKLAIFKKDDGGFSYYPKNSATRSQGATVALGGAKESDVNATGICTNGTVSNMLEALGFENIPRYCPEDFAVFMTEFEELGTIIKDEIPSVETITFDSYSSGDGMEVGGVVTYPDDYVTNYVGDSDQDNEGNYKWFESDVVKNPDPNAKSGDKVLYASQKTYPGEEKNKAIAASVTYFEIANSGIGSSGNCFVYDADMYFEYGNGVICQLFFTGERDENRPVASFNFETYTDGGVKYVKIGENYAGLDGIKDGEIAGGIPFGEWVNIRIEFYKIIDEVEDPVTGLTSTKYTPKLKVFVNNEYQGECDANITGGGTYYNRTVSNVSISYYRFNAAAMYFNNVLVERIQAPYTTDTNPNKIVEVPIPDEPMRESYGFEDGLLNTSNVRNKVNVNYFGSSRYINATEEQTYNPTVSYSIADDPTGAVNKVLRAAVTKTTEFQASKTEVHLYNSESDGNAYTFTGNFYYDSDSIKFLSDVTQLFFLDSKGKSNYSLRIAARSNSGIKVLSLIEYNTKTDDGDTGDGKTIFENIPCDAWFTLRIDFHKTLDASTTVAKISINGEEILDDFSYKASALNDTVIESVSISHQRTNSSTVYLDDLSFARSGLEFIPVPPPKTVADFEDGELGGDFLDNYVSALDSNGSAVVLNARDVENMSDYSAYTTYSLENDPTGAVNKALKIVKQKNADASSSTTVVKLSEAEEGASCYAFETRLYIESIGAYDVMRITISSDTQKLVGFRLYVEGGKVKVRHNNGGTGGTGTGDVLDYSGNVLTLAKQTWLTLRIEFYKSNNSDTTMCKFYIAEGDGELTAKAEVAAYTVYGLNSAYTPSKTTVEHYNKGNGYTMYFDDVFFKAENKNSASGDETPDAGEENELVEVLPVYGGASGVVTFMHDDGIYDSAIEIDKLLVKHGLVSDVALIASKATSNYPTIKKWQGIFATERWKAVSHSMTHSWWGIEPDDGDVTKVTDNVEKANSEIVSSQAKLREVFPGQRVLGFAYPRFTSIYNKYIYTNGELDREKLLTYMDSAYVRGLVEQNYVAGRVGTGYVSLDDTSSVDWEYMPGTHVHDNVSEVIDLVNSAAENGNFCLLYTHGVIYAEDGVYVSGGTPSWQLDRIFERISALVDEGLIWNTYYEDAVMYIREAESAAVSIDGDENGYTVILTDEMDDSIYNHPLTVKIKAPSSWQAAKIVQGDSVTYASVAETDGTRYLLANIVPDAGEATVTPISLTEIPAEEEKDIIPTPTLETSCDFESGFHSDFVENEFVTKDGEAVDPETTDISASADYSSMSLTSDPENAANQVLKVVNKSGSAGNGTKTTAYFSSENNGGACYVFETKIYLDDLTGGTADNAIMSFNFTLAGTSSNALGLCLKHTSNSSLAKLAWKNGASYTGDGDVLDSDGNLVTLSVDTWYTLKVEFYQTMDADTTRCVIYLATDGGELSVVADETAYSYWGLSKAPTFVRIGYLRYKTKYTVYIDDVSFKSENKEYVSETEAE